MLSVFIDFFLLSQFAIHNIVHNISQSICTSWVFV